MIKGKGINGELKISTLLETYTDECYQEVKKMDSSYPWLDKGSHNSMLNELNFDRDQNLTHLTLNCVNLYLTKDN